MAFALAAAAAAIATAAFVHGFVRLRRRGRTDLAGRGRAALFGLGIALWLFAFSAPVDELADRLLAGHMFEHLLIGDAVPALLLVAVRGPLFFFLLPARLLRRLAKLTLLRSCVAQLLRPSVAFAVWAGSVALWHIPSLYDRTLENNTLHGLEHGMFVLGGTLVWMQLIDPAGRRKLTPTLRLGYALALVAGSMALANTLVLTYAPLYPAYAAQAHRPLGLSALGDQDLGGLVMLVEQLATLGTFTAIMLRRWLRGPLVIQADQHPLTV